MCCPSLGPGLQKCRIVSWRTECAHGTRGHFTEQAGGAGKTAGCGARAPLALGTACIGGSGLSAELGGGRLFRAPWARKALPHRLSGGASHPCPLPCLDLLLHAG